MRLGPARPPACRVGGAAGAVELGAPGPRLNHVWRWRAGPVWVETASMLEEPWKRTEETWRRTEETR